MNTSGAFWAFLAGAVVVHWLLPQRFRAGLLVVVSAAWLTWLDRSAGAPHLPFSALAAAGFGCVFWFVTQKITTRPRYLVPLLILGALGFLAYFKYVPPIRDSIRGRIEDPREPAVALLVPLGISYYTFKLVHYAIESGRKNIPAHGLDTFLAYLLFFPMFTAGPIERFDRWLANRTDRLSRDQVVNGLTRIMYGVVKKLVIVDLILARSGHRELKGLAEAIPVWSPALQPVELVVAALPVVHPLVVWQFLINQFLTIYLDFSAYSDLAIGAGLLFGVKLMENFDYPIFATNISDFWRRWHVSLSSYCQQYVYLPVIGLTRNPYLAIVFTMAAIGLWHEGSWNYLAWALFHAAFLIAYLSWGRVKRRYGIKITSRFVGVLGAIFTFLMCSAAQAFVVTHAMPNGLRAASRILGALVGIHVRPGPF